MLRPPELVAARAAMRAGQLEPGEYRLVEDRAVDEALRIQESAGVDVVTDGEMRRDIFFDFFVSGLAGLSPLPAETVHFHGKTAEDAMEVAIPFSVTDKISARPCPAVEEFRYLKERTALPIKVTLPSPMLMLAFWSEHSRDVLSGRFRGTSPVTPCSAGCSGWRRTCCE